MSSKVEYNAIISESINGRASCQSGKTTYVTKRVLIDACKQDYLPVVSIFNYANIATDFLAKINSQKNNHGNKPFNIIDSREKDTRYKKQNVGMSRLGEIIASTGNLDRDRKVDYRQTVLTGLSNHHYLRRLAYLLTNFDGTVPLYADEGDPLEMGYDIRFRTPSSRTGIVGESATNNSFRNFIEKNMFSQVNLISATNALIAISSIEFNSVKKITPGRTYNNNHIYFIVKLSDIKALEKGILTPKMAEFVNLIENNILINICQTIECHENIGLAFKNMEDVKYHELNMNNTSFDVNDLNKGKHIVGGGRKFGRGATFPRVGGIIFDKASSHCTNIIQAVGRGHGYKASPTILCCTQEQKDKLEAAYEFESQISTIDLLESSPERRWNKIRQIAIPDVGLKILPTNANGWHQINKRGISRIERI